MRLSIKSCFTSALCALLTSAPLLTPAPLLAAPPNVAKEVYGLVDRHFLDQSAFDRGHWSTRVMSESAELNEAKALVRSLGDRYSRVLSKQEVGKLLQKYDGSGGLNLIASEDGQPGVFVGITPADGTPLARAGIKLGDRIVELNGRDARAMSIDEAEWVVAQADTVETRIQPCGGRPPLSLQLDKPAATTTPSKRLRSSLTRWPGGGATAWVRLGEFTSDSGWQVRKEVEQLKSRGANRLVLDLRGNGGGAFSGALSVAGLFIDPKGDADPPVVITTEVGGKQITHTSLEHQVWAGPMEVWVDWQTASSSEIVVGALQDNCRARVVGIGRTYGKGIGQRVYGLSDGTALVQTIVRETTPAGREILGGLQPDEQRLLLSSFMGSAGLAVDIQGATFAQPLCLPPCAQDQTPAPWRTQRGPRFAAAIAPVIAGGWLVVGVLAAWAGFRNTT